MEAGTLGSIEVTMEFNISITRKTLKLVVLHHIISQKSACLI